MDPYSRTVSMEQEIRKIVIRELRSAVKMRNWKVVVEKFKSLPFPEIQATKMNKWGDTALHAAIISGTSEITVGRLIEAIKMSEDDAIHTLSAINDSGNTPLHCAASRGSVLLCHRIISVEKSLVGKRNKEGETPLFLSAMCGHLETFRYLFSVDDQNSSTYSRRLKDGDTILHCTIKRKYFDLSLEIIRLSKDLAFFVNEKGESPLEILASTPSAFRSSTPLRWWESLCYPFIIWVDYKKPRPQRGGKDHTADVGDSETDQIRETSDAAFRFPSIVEKKKRHLRGWQIMQKLVEEDPLYDNLMETDIMMIENGGPRPATMSISPSNVRDIFPGPLRCSSARDIFPGPLRLAREDRGARKSKKRTALLRATKYGAIEVVRAILEKKPFAIDDETEEKKNIVLVAVEERQSTILTYLMTLPSWKEERLKYACDQNGNTALHLAAELSYNTDLSMSVIHLQWEVLWFQYVMTLMPPSFIDQPNKEGKTPGTIFNEHHRKMMEESNSWVKDMSGNYIVAATLISSVTFATCYQIPGGYDGQSGIPIVGPRTAVFQMFAIAALVSFCSSITALAAFLAIYSSQNDQARHYRRSLPLKLCLGLSSLFVSIISMLISFCAAHTYELDPRFKSKCVPLYAALTAIPICFYTATQIPLYSHLLTASLSNVPLPKLYDKEEEQEEEEEERKKKEEEERKRKEGEEGERKRKKKRDEDHEDEAKRREERQKEEEEEERKRKEKRDEDHEDEAKRREERNKEEEEEEETRKELKKNGESIDHASSSFPHLSFPSPDMEAPFGFPSGP